MRKTLGAANAVRAVLAPLSDHITRAFVFGSPAAGTDQPGRDIDLLVIGDVALTELVRVLYPLLEVLAHKINPKLYQPVEWERMVAIENAFARDLLGKPRIALIGAVA